MFEWNSLRSVHKVISDLGFTLSRVWIIAAQVPGAQRANVIFYHNLSLCSRNETFVSFRESDNVLDIRLQLSEKKPNLDKWINCTLLLENTIEMHTKYR